jgi:AcrR family transcriptional regulator
MTEKQELILSVALNLFAKQGFAATPTSQIAKEARVSEGLIFRHFGNKEGLLQAILDEGQVRVQAMVSSIAQETDPRRVIARVIDLPVLLIEQEREFWGLQFALKYSQKILPPKQQDTSVIALTKALYQAFDALGYDYPDKETEFLMIFLEGLSSAMLTQDIQVSGLIRFVKVKYDVVQPQKGAKTKRKKA